MIIIIRSLYNIIIYAKMRAFAATATFLLFCLGVHVRGNDVDTVVEKLKEKVADGQVLKPTRFSPFITFETHFGVYECNIRANLPGGPIVRSLRDRLVAIFDNNAFATLLVSSILLEASQFHKGPPVSDLQVLYAIQAISRYHDKNYALNDSIVVFWPQTYNSTSGEWWAYPTNIGRLLNPSVGFLDKVDRDLSEVGLSHLADELKEQLEGLQGGLDAFFLPADFDSTFVNLGFGSLLGKSAPQWLFDAWWTNNSHLTAAMEALKKYAYRPMSKDLDAAFIDPRTFFYVREYLYSVQERDVPVAIPVTWVETLSEDKNGFEKKYRMPFNVNNVDLTVSANVVYGISAAVLSNLSSPTEWFDEDLQMIYENTSDVIAWMIERNFSSRPDLALTYYPSVYNFYWFTARTLNLLASADHLPFPVMETVKERLTLALRNATTNVLLKTAVIDGDLAYFDDFLGNADKDVFGKPVKHGEDRICSTAMAVNALLYSWTEGGHLLPDTPTAVRDLVSRSCQWLIMNTLMGEYKPYSVVFSGSVKSFGDHPFFYPANFNQFLNGSAIPPGPLGFSPEAVIGVRGVIPREEYQQLLQEEHYGMHTPLDFHGYNSASGWPFWSSEPFTYASAMLALTQYRALVNTGELGAIASRDSLTRSAVNGYTVQPV